MNSNEIVTSGVTLLERKTSPDYPVNLITCEDRPGKLWFKSVSTPDEVFNNPDGAVAIVGTRDPSPYGVSCVGSILSRLHENGKHPTIISGLALGIETEAHRVALELGFPTVAVMGNGIDTVYPNQNWQLANSIETTGRCALITPFPFGTAPMAVNFIRRNHVIAGLSDTVIVVESKEKGGAVVTAKLAFEYNRTVIAVPGRMDDVRSAGCNALISQGIAEILTPTTLII